MEKRYTVTGMTCSACSSGIERVVGRLDGVTMVDVSLMGKCMKIDYDGSRLSEDEIFSCVRSLGYGIYEEGQEPKEKRPYDTWLLIRFIVSVAILVPLMYVSMGHMFGAPMPAFMDPETNPQWFCLVQFVLSAAVIGINYAYFKNGFMAVVHRSPDMDTLVSLGSGVSFIYSTVIMILAFTGVYGGSAFHDSDMMLYFESAAMIPALVDIGKWLEEKSKRKTGEEVEKLLRLAPDRVTLEEDGETREVSVRDVKVGDVVVVRQGEYIPVDGVVLSGDAFVDRSAITGESIPVEVSEGDAVTSAALDKGGVIRIRADKVGEDTTLSKIVRMVRDAGSSKAPIQKFADRVAGIFVPVVIMIAVITFAVWMIVDGGFVPSHCVMFAINVLVVSCPCALGLATPVAIMTATGKGASLGILYKDAESLQKMRSVNCVLMDKTATITEGRPAVTDVECFGMSERDALYVACGIEKNSNHPIARCIVEHVGDGAAVTDFSYAAGKGASASYGGRAYTLGNERLAGMMDARAASESDRLSSQGKTVLYLSEDGVVVALIAVADTVKEDSAEAVSLLKDRGLRVAMLTGDGEAAAKAVAASVGIDEYVSDVLPEDKLTAVKNVQSVGGVVAMVGDGINDSPALKQADVGIAIGTGTDVAIDSAEVVLVSEDLRTLDTVFDLSRATVRNIEENLFWAFFYNVIMIPVAAGVFYPLGFTFDPMISAACMCVSSLFVVCNALRLLRYRNRRFSGGTAVVAAEGRRVVTVRIKGMTCEHCVRRVTDALIAVDGVKYVSVDLKRGRAEVCGDGYDDASLAKAVTDAGYRVREVK